MKKRPHAIERLGTWWKRKVKAEVADTKAVAKVVTSPPPPEPSVELEEPPK